MDPEAGSNNHIAQFDSSPNVFWNRILPLPPQQSNIIKILPILHLSESIQLLSESILSLVVIFVFYMSCWLLFISYSLGKLSGDSWMGGWVMIWGEIIKWGFSSFNKTTFGKLLFLILKIFIFFVPTIMVSIFPSNIVHLYVIYDLWYMTYDIWFMIYEFTNFNNHHLFLETCFSPFPN